MLIDSAQRTVCHAMPRISKWHRQRWKWSGEFVVRKGVSWKWNPSLGWEK